jgi:threonine dehydrogenase-like Zn-dependent dehydrogenase
MAVPVTALHPLPDTVTEVAGALVEPGGSALRALWSSAVDPGERVLVLGPGTIGLLVALFALAHGAEVHVLGLTRRSLDFARALGVHGAWTAADLPRMPFDAVIDASNAPGLRPWHSSWSSRASGWSTSGWPAVPAPSTPGPWC